MADVMNPNVSEKERRTFEAFRRYLIPLAGVVETIATKGRSPGTTAMAAEQNFQNQEDRRRQMLKEEEDRQAAALERALKGKQQELYTEQLEGAKEERARGAKERSALESAIASEQNLSPSEKAAINSAGGKAYLDYVLGGKRAESGIEGLMARLLNQKDIADMNIKSREKIAGNKQQPLSDTEKPIKLTESEKKMVSGYKLAAKAAEIMDKYGKELTVGPVRGGVMKFLGGKTPETPINTEFRSAISSARGLMFSYLIGAGQTESEAKRLADSYFDINQDPGVLRGKITGALDFFKTNIPSKYNLESETPLQITSKTQTSVSSDSTVFDENKKKRLEELRAKKSAGTLR